MDTSRDIPVYRNNKFPTTTSMRHKSTLKYPFREKSGYNQLRLNYKSSIRAIRSSAINSPPQIIQILNTFKWFPCLGIFVQSLRCCPLFKSPATYHYATHATLMLLLLLGCCSCTAWVTHESIMFVVYCSNCRWLAACIVKQGTAFNWIRWKTRVACFFLQVDIDFFLFFCGPMSFWCS